jgi:zinc transport system substrate-binding protein
LNCPAVLSLMKDHRLSRARWLLAVIFLAGIAGCDRSPTPSTPEGAGLHVISSVYPLADIVRQIAGDNVDLQWFCENGQDPRDLRLTDAQQKSARSADLLITSGFRELWAGDTLTGRQQALRLIQPDSTNTGREIADAHGALWLHPQVVAEVADLIRERLTLLDSKHESEYRAAAKRARAEIETIDEEFRTRLAPLKGKRFLSLRPTWSTLLVRYDIEEVTPLNTDPQRLTDEDVRKLKDTARETGINILAVDAALLPGVQRELQMRTGLQLLLLDPLGSSAPDGRSTWTKLMRYNLDQLEKGLR